MTESAIEQLACKVREEVRQTETGQFISEGRERDKELTGVTTSEYNGSLYLSLKTKV